MKLQHRTDIASVSEPRGSESVGFSSICADIESMARPSVHFFLRLRCCPNVRSVNIGGMVRKEAAKLA